MKDTACGMASAQESYVRWDPGNSGGGQLLGVTRLRACRRAAGAVVSHTNEGLRRHQGPTTRTAPANEGRTQRPHLSERICTCDQRRQARETLSGARLAKGACWSPPVAIELPIITQALSHFHLW